MQSSADLLAAQKNRAKQPKQKKAINKPNAEEEDPASLLSPHQGQGNLESEDQRTENIITFHSSEPVVESKVSEDNNTMMNSQVAYQQGTASYSHAPSPDVVPVPVEEISASNHSNAAGLVHKYSWHLNPLYFLIYIIIS